MSLHRLQNLIRTLQPAETAEKINPIRFVLLGGGHTNTQILKHVHKANVADGVELILVSDYNTSLYSGMCPGGVAQQYQESQFSVDLRECCEKLGWTFICKTIIEINDKENMLIATDGTRIKYDILSIDIGSTNVGLNKCEGVKQYAISTRPLKLLMDKVNESETVLLDKLKRQCAENDNKEQCEICLDIVCVGGGCAGCELTMCLTHRLKANIKQFIVSNKLNIKDINIKSTIITSAEQILCLDPKALQLSVLEALKARNIDIITKHWVTKIDENKVYLSQNEKEHAMKYDICIWSTGAAAHELETHSLARDECGWIKVNKYLQSVSHPNVFGAGDCVNIIDYGNDANVPPKAGVYAVREGPVLVYNLKQYLHSVINMDHKPFQAYIPQTDFLRLLNIGNGKAIGCKHGISFEGAWVLALKDWIDVSWMNKFDANNLFIKDSAYFKPQIDENESKSTEEEETKSIENGVRALLINDEPNECGGFAFQWKVLLQMNDDKQFCDAVVKLFQELV